MTDGPQSFAKAAPLPVGRLDAPVWELPWLTPAVCRVLLIGLILFGVFSRLSYLHSAEALDLAPDEAQYWLWSKQLDWSYYSKPGMVAWIIAVSTAVFGDTMPAVRYPAMAIGVLTTLMTYLLTAALFRSERLALGAVGLCHVVPMFIAGSMLMTIDPPLVLFWSGATCVLCIAVVGGRTWGWPVAGVLIGLGFLSKYVALVWLVGVLVALLVDSGYRRHLRTRWPWVMTAIASVFTLPVLYWNARNGWVSAQHVRADTTSGFNPLEPLSFLGGTIGAVNPLLFVVLVAGGWCALSWSRQEPVGSAVGAAGPGGVSPWEQVRRARLLVLTVLPYALLVTASTMFTNAQINWSAPVWFALLIVGAWFLGTRMQSLRVWKRWRWLLWGTVLTALVVAPLAHQTPSLYPLFAYIQKNLLGYEEVQVRRWDPTARLRGWSRFARDLDELRLRHLGPDAFILTDDRSDASALAFYTPGQPKTYVMGPYIEDPSKRGRTSQFDIWPDRSLERSSTTLLGKNAIYFGPRWPVLDKAFESVEPLPPIEVTETFGGVKYHLSTRRPYLLRNFKGFDRPGDGKIEY